MTRDVRNAWAIGLVFVSFLLAGVGSACAGQDVRLILQITVDGLRGDLLNRYGDRFGPDGFRYLLSEGAVFNNAHYQHANTETIVGHTTLATGTSPSRHGMVGNVWLDRESGELVYNIEDPAHPLLPTREIKKPATQLDPTQKASRTNGRSPNLILASTFSDELFVHTGGRAKIFSVSGKDRGAVPLAGHSGKAFWYSTDSGDFVSSSYYYKAYPDWVANWNAKELAASHEGQSWYLLNEPSTYLFANSDDRPYERDLYGYGRTFPHAFGSADSKLFTTYLLVSPVGDQLTNDFAKAVIANEGLGQDDVPDYLAVSFSSVDAVNHFFGPSSLENEDVVLQLDRVLADLLRFVDDKVGLDQTLIVLSADHGMAEMPEFMAENGMPVGRIHSDEIESIANKAAFDRFGLERVVQRFFRPYLYLDAEVIKQASLDRSKVEKAVADALMQRKGIAMAVPVRYQGTMADAALLGQIRSNSHAQRSGDIYVVQAPYWFLFEKGPIAVMHGSPWRYDTFVPVIFAGPGIEPQEVSRLVRPADVAPTLSSFLGTKFPSSATGSPLREVLGQR
jgi:predicted AlkP superfamily pyrophosphatase or phosphodiesterase